jgi:hypothetical protein
MCVRTLIGMLTSGVRTNSTSILHIRASADAAFDRKRIQSFSKCATAWIGYTRDVVRGRLITAHFVGAFATQNTRRLAARAFRLSWCAWLDNYRRQRHLILALLSKMKARRAIRALQHRYAVWFDRMYGNKVRDGGTKVQRKEEGGSRT